MATRDHTGSVALVTGGSGGIGGGIARRLGAAGFATVVGYSKSASSAEAVVNEITAAGGVATAVAADLTKAQDVHSLFQAAIDKYGRIDAVINNAGTIVPVAVADITEAFYEKVFDVNVRGALFVLKEAAKRIHDGGRIISTSSTLVGAPIAGSALYTGSKAALEAFSRVLARELGGRGVTVNAIRVGPTVPGMFEKAPPERQAAMAAASPFKRLGTPDDVADVVAFLVSEKARWLTGQIITLDGGAT